MSEFFINPDGSRASDDFESATGFRCGYAIAKVGDLRGIINLRFQWVCPPTFKHIGGFISPTLAYAQRSDGPYIFIAPDGARIGTLDFDRISFLGSDGVFAVRRGGLWGFLDESLRQVTPFMYKEVEYFSCGRCWVAEESRHCFIDNSGRFVELAWPAHSRFYRFGMQWRRGRPNVFAYFNLDGQRAFDREFTLAYDFHDGGFAMVNGGDYDKKTVIDRSGRTILKNVENAGDPGGGLISVQLRKTWGFADITGRLLIEPRFSEVKWFGGHGLCPVALKGRWGYLSSDGDFKIKPQFDYAQPFSDDVALVTAN